MPGVAGVGGHHPAGQPDTNTAECAALLPGGDPAEVLVGAGEGVWCGGGGHGHYSSGARLLSSPRHSVVFEAQRMTMGCHNHQEVQETQKKATSFVDIPCL